jgi:class 3 adenylate cyclase
MAIATASQYNNNIIKKNLTGREPMERKLTAIMAADVVGYSRLMGADEAGAHAALDAPRTSASRHRPKE